MKDEHAEGIMQKGAYKKRKPFAISWKLGISLGIMIVTPIVGYFLMKRRFGK